MDHLPLFVDLRGRDCLVVGGGGVAARKAELLLGAGARVRVAAPELGVDLAALAAAGRVAHLADPFDPSQLAGISLAVAATDDQAVNSQVARVGRARGVWVNVVDHPQRGDVIVPAIIERRPVTIAVSTGGASPVLARLLRGRLEALIPAGYGRLATLAADYRHKVKAALPTPRRRPFWEGILEGAVAEKLFAGDEPGAKRLLEQTLAAAQRQREMPTGEVYLVGAGPGDPDLLTFRALRLMQRAEVVVHDRLVPEAILELTRRDARRIFVGKQRSQHSLPQEAINQLLVEQARAGRRVVRLKGGDPFVFARGGEELESLMAAGVPCQVVPGVTAANGCGAYAGIPLTHRDHAEACVLVTGHLRDGTPQLPWETLARPRQTLVFYMGIQALGAICRGLVDHGLTGETPAAVVERG
ncbi:MAG: siroheme synthase CysG, partial [Candidatus Competibacteraceae bacterium]|nr:siroheme synthase CysG [Candidatus Competibacteraceae bacterium]